MSEAVTATNLLRSAAAFFDAPDHQLAASARHAWKNGFDSGGEWMRAALSTMRKKVPPNGGVRFSKLGAVKYGLASTAALLVVGMAWWLKQLWLLPGAIPVFYWVEAQMVFLFPLALDGFSPGISESTRWTGRAGGTWRVMSIVMPIAASMIFGGFLGRGFVRSWCVGCLAILVWYEKLRAGQNSSARRPLLEIGTTLSLHVRREQLRIFGNSKPVRVFYASDLHCRGENSRRAMEQLVCAAHENSPDLILLGGDLADTKSGLPLLTKTVAALSTCAPVWAVAGNHDERVGPRDVIAAIGSGGGHWLSGRSILWRSDGREPFYLDGVIPESVSSGHKRILCAHDPAIFPRAAALGYPLILAGHLHGSQFVWVERRGRLFPGAWFYRWNGLRFERGRSTMLVSRGVSDTLPVRWNCPREILLCELY